MDFSAEETPVVKKECEGLDEPPSRGMVDELGGQTLPHMCKCCSDRKVAGLANLSDEVNHNCIPLWKFGG